MKRQVIVSDAARRDVRAIDRETAYRILQAIAHFVTTGEGDVKQLVGREPKEYRLRVGDYRVRLYEQAEAIQIIAVKHRREAYR